MPMKDDYAKIVDALGALIRREIAIVASEQSWPGGDSDRSDDKIKDGTKKAANLRRIREDFENIATGFMP